MGQNSVPTTGRCPLLVESDPGETCGESNQRDWPILAHTRGRARGFDLELRSESAG